MDGVPPVGLAETFGEVARTLLAEGDAQKTLQRIVLLAVQTIDSCQYAGISVIEHRRVSSPASSDEVPKTVDRIQSETGEGPCVDAIREHEVFQTGQLSNELRWPKFSERAHAESGVESIVSFRLFAEEDTMGALNLYSTEREAFDDSDLAVGAVFATHAAVAWKNSKMVENLAAGMESRQIIGEAVGLIMAREDISEEEAFSVLQRASQRMNVKLRLIADQIVHPMGHQPEGD